MRHATPRHHRRSLHDSLEMINRRGLPGNLKSAVCQERQHAVTPTVKRVLEHSLEEEWTEYLG